MSQPNQQQQQQNQNARTAEAVGQLAGSLLGAGLRLAASGERSRASFLGLSLSLSSFEQENADMENHLTIGCAVYASGCLHRCVR